MYNRESPNKKYSSTSNDVTRITGHWQDLLITGVFVVVDDDDDDDDDGGNEDLPSVVNSRVLCDQIGMKLSPRQYNF